MLCHWTSSSLVLKGYAVFWRLATSHQVTLSHIRTPGSSWAFFKQHYCSCWDFQKCDREYLLLWDPSEWGHPCPSIYGWEQNKFMVFFEYTEMDKIQKRCTCLLYFHSHNHLMIVAPKTILNMWPIVAVSFEVTGRMIALVSLCVITGKGKGFPQQATVAQGVPGRLRPRIFLTFGTTRVVGRQPYTPADFTPGEIPGTHF